jgi:hypothetical protein
MAGAVQIPQLATSPPQPSAIGPQSAPEAAHVVGVHAPRPQVLGFPPPPHTSGAAHAPQSTTTPQPSPMGPQLAPAAAHVSGAQRAASGPASATKLGGATGAPVSAGTATAGRAPESAASSKVLRSLAPQAVAATPNPVTRREAVGSQRMRRG